MTESNLEVKQWKIDDLIGAEYNPRKLSDEQKQTIKDSIKRFGLVDPVLVNINTERKGIIIGGHQRTMIARELGFKKMPCIELDLTLEKEKELNVRLNKNTGEFDFDLLSEHFGESELISWGFADDEVEFFEMDEDEFGEDFDLPDGDKEPFQQITYTLADEQAEYIKNIIADIKQTEEYKYMETFGNENSNGNALYLMATKWGEQKK
jgi:hypothetical protein